MQNQQPPTMTYVVDDLPPPPPYSSVSNTADPEQVPESDGFKLGFESGFHEASIRRAFIRKVYGILACQLTVTSIVVTLFLFVESIQLISWENPWLWKLFFLATIICLIILDCCPNVRRSWPSNIIVLSIFTVLESFLLGSIASCYEQEAVLIAVIITVVVVVALTMFAMQTKFDFTMCSGCLLVLIIVLLCMGFMLIFFRTEGLYIIFACFGAMVFSMYLVFDTQLMLGGKHRYAVSPEEYIFAAVNLYLDIIGLFRFILQLVGRARG